VARSAWKERCSNSQKTRISRNVKVSGYIYSSTQHTGSLLFTLHWSFVDRSQLQLLLHDKIWFGEVQYYFQMDFNAERSDSGHGNDNDSEASSHPSIHSLTQIKMYSRPDEELLQKSSTALSICHLEDDEFTVVPLTQIKAVVGMVPFNPLEGRPYRDKYFVMKKMGHINKFYEDNIDVESDLDANVDVD
jgi:hypothetical protein